jgi:hypothetical protein
VAEEKKYKKGLESTKMEKKIKHLGIFPSMIEWYLVLFTMLLTKDGENNMVRKVS